MRRAFVLIVLIAMVVAGCGDDKKSDSSNGSGSEGKSDETTTTEKKADADPDKVARVKAGLDDDAPFTADQVDCLANAVARDISDEGLDELEKKDSDLENLSADDLEVVKSATDECIPVEDLVSEMVGELDTDESLPLTEDEKSCLSDSLKDAYKSSGDLLVATATGQGAKFQEQFHESLGGCITGDTLRKMLVTELSSKDVSETDGNCIVDKLLDAQSTEELYKLIVQAGEGDTTDLENATKSAAQACSVAMSGG